MSVTCIRVSNVVVVKVDVDIRDVNKSRLRQVGKFFLVLEN